MTLDLKAGLSSRDFSPWHGLDSLSLSWRNRSNQRAGGRGLFFLAGGSRGMGAVACCFIDFWGRSTPTLHSRSFPGDPESPMPGGSADSSVPEGMQRPAPLPTGPALPWPSEGALSPRITRSGKKITHTRKAKPNLFNS